jgi:enoyl-CoA hydratase/carnithine racemase
MVGGTELPTGTQTSSPVFDDKPSAPRARLDLGPVVAEVVDDIGIVMIDDGEQNFIVHELSPPLLSALEFLAHHRAKAVVTIGGAGYFLSAANPAEILAYPGMADLRIEHGAIFQLGVGALPVPLVSCLTGSCSGNGALYPTLSDVVIAADVPRQVRLTANELSAV